MRTKNSPRSAQRLIGAAGGLALLVAGLTTTPAAATDYFQATTMTPGETLTVRSGPQTSYGQLAQLPDKSTIQIRCQVTDGTAVTGPYGTTRVWDKINLPGGKVGYVSDAWVWTGSNGLVAPKCQQYPGSGGGSDDGGSATNVGQRAVQIAMSHKDEGPNATWSPNGEAWCNMFATWVWQQAGISTIEMEGYTGSTFNKQLNTGRSKFTGSAQEVLAIAAPGDMIMYGDGPAWPQGDYVPSTHVDMVVKNHGDHLEIVGGNFSNKVTHRFIYDDGRVHGLSDIYGVIKATP